MSNSSSDPDLTRRRTVASALAVIALVAVLAFTWWIDGRDGVAASPPSASALASDTDSAHLSSLRTTAPRPNAPPSNAPRSSASRSGARVPARVSDTLEQIDAGRWPEAARAPGTRGGDTFRNNERRLPIKDSSGRRIAYREWDVNARERGRGRDAERIVTGSDGTAWYTLDHYQTFIQIRGPSA